MLPKYELPTYETILPFSKKKVVYRPYTTKEEKILMLAAAGDDENELVRASRQILKLCAEVELDDLAAVDVEWLFIKLYAASVGSSIDIVINTECEGQCKSELKSAINLNAIEVRNITELEESFKSVKEGWIIPMNDRVGMVVSPVDNYKNLENEEYVWECLKYIYKGEEVVNKNEVSKEQFLEWFEGYPRIEKQNVEKFFKINPYTYYNSHNKCGYCGKAYAFELTDIIDFLK